MLPRHEIARVSELLQSQLLSPVSNIPLQPRLAESSLLLISSDGAATASFNEFNPLFTRNGLALQLGGLGGSNDTWGGDAIVSGIHDKFAFSIGYSRFTTDGFRVNADQDDWVGNAFLQYDFTPNTSAQFEYRHREIDRGDTALRIFELVGMAQTSLPPKQDRMLRMYAEALEAYRLRRWVDAMEMFRQCLVLWPSDGPSRLMGERCGTYLETPPPEDWDGAFAHLSK